MMTNQPNDIARRRQKRWSGIVIAAAVLAAAAIGVTAFSVFRTLPMARHLPPSSQRVVPGTMLSRLTAISQAGLHQILPLKHDSLRAIRPSDQAVLAKAGAWQHQEHALLFIGAGFCPYCAAMRWPVVLTLLRFGQLDHLTLTRSGAYDIDPDTPTFGFRRVGFTALGNSLDFRSLELMNRQRQAEQQPTVAETALMQRLDRSPYTRFAGGIPMIVIGDRMVQLGAPVSPALFKGMDWQQVVNALTSGHGPLWQSVMAQTNRLTKAVCAVTEKQPSRICEAPAVVQSNRAASKVSLRNVLPDMMGGGLMVAWSYSRLSFN